MIREEFVDVVRDRACDADVAPSPESASFRSAGLPADERLGQWHT
ncbi:hypothetical protein IWX65_001622 [Arthrobacter sp. CAN_A214]